jgi:hypothetical protein
VDYQNRKIILFDVLIQILFVKHEINRYESGDRNTFAALQIVRWLKNGTLVAEAVALKTVMHPIIVIQEFCDLPLDFTSSGKSFCMGLPCTQAVICHLHVTLQFGFLPNCAHRITLELLNMDK